MLQQIRSQSERWSDILSLAEFDQIDVLLELLGKARVKDAEAEQEAVIAAEIDSAKLAEFKTSLVEAFEVTGRLRSLIRKIGNFRDLSHGSPRSEIQSWGFNQLDDKGAFILQSRVSYPLWGESYGRGLAQAEDEIAFTRTTENAAIHDRVRKVELISKIEGHLVTTKLESTVIIQSLSAILEFEGLNRSDLFIPKYRKDCPSTPLTDLNGFIGILKLQGQSIPVFDLYVQRTELKNKVLLSDLSRFLRWEQLSPVDEISDEQDRRNVLVARVVDLNKDDQLRGRIISEAPDWLRDQVDGEKYLRARVVVNVFEKFKIEIVDRTAGVSIDVADDSANAVLP